MPRELLRPQIPQRKDRETSSAPTKISPTPPSVGASLPRELLRPQIPQQKIARQARSHKNFTNPTLCRSELASRAVAASDTAAKKSRDKLAPTRISPPPASVGASLLASCCSLRYRSKKIASKLAPTGFGRQCAYGISTTLAQVPALTSA